ncbi:glycosyltransferase [Anaerococcus tetradius]|uniref:glycosyltransferase n=1 Tax=Anaerococcus tetradius TaxID=33036 RepID=UPI0023F2E307|nr:glycosyltransferase [Anaerococcus tetradius]
MDNYKSKTKILYVLDSLKQRSGVTAVAMNYFRNIDKNRVHIDFLVLEDSEDNIVQEITNLGSAVYFMPKLGLFNVSKVAKFYNDFFKEHDDYKIIHSHFNQIDFMVFHYAKKYGAKHCISHSHNTKYSDNKLKSVRNRMMCLPIRYIADTWAACGIKAGQFLYGKDFLKSKRHLIINNAINIDKFTYNLEIRNKKRSELGLENKFIIGNVGRLRLQKNQSYLLSLFSEFLKEKKYNEMFHLLLVGDGELKNSLKKLSCELNISDFVTFLGTRSDVNELLQAMDVFVLPSLYEGLPVIGIEAQASGLPCLFSNNVTDEVSLCNSKFLPLSDDFSPWINEITESNRTKRYDTRNVIIEKGFSIKDEANKLTDFYCNIL